MSKTITLKYPTVISKKYLAKYQQYKDYTPPAYTPLIGCIYQAKTADNINIIGMLMEYDEVRSIVKDKCGVLHIVLSNTLKTVMAL